MIDGRFTECEWQTIVAALPSHPPSDTHTVRLRLELAAARYCEDEPYAKQMHGAAEKRDNWKKIYENTQGLIRSLSTVDRWHAPLWREDDPAGKARVIKVLQDLALHAKFTAGDYDERQIAPRERLNIDILSVWTDVLRQNLAWSVGGPVVRFVRAVMSATSLDVPADTTVRDIIKREKARRISAQIGPVIANAERRATSDGARELSLPAAQARPATRPR